MSWWKTALWARDGFGEVAVCPTVETNDLPDDPRSARLLVKDSCFRPLVSVVIPNYNGRDFLSDCLTAIASQSYSNHRVVVSDNGSTDGSLEMMAEKHPSTLVVQNGRNLGFAAACNIGIRASDSPLIATLNNDTLPEPRWLEELVKGMEDDSSVGMCSSKMLFYHIPGMINSTGISLDRAGIAWDRGGGEPDDPGETAPVEIFGPCAGAALYRRTMLDRTGLFDEDYFAYLEDVDLAWRARLAGWRCLYMPEARVYHVHSATAVEGSPFKSFLLGRNKIATIVKNYPMPHLLAFLPAILFYDLASLPYALIARGDASPLKGRIAALRQMPRLLAKRRTVQWTKRVSSSEACRLMRPLQNPLRIPGRYKHLRQVASVRASCPPDIGVDA